MMADEEYRRLVCGGCRGVFTSEKPLMYCSKRCTWVAQSRKKRERAAAHKASLPSRPCKRCAVLFTPSSASNSMFCTRKCKQRWHNDARQAPLREAAAARRQERAAARQLEVRRKQEIVEARAARRAQEAIAQAMLANRKCEDCGALTGRLKAKLCLQCSDERARNQKRAARVRWKARQRVATVETVDPIKVFERAGWRCYLCGCQTPKDLRGTFEPNAPELEHVQPLARGGAHSYANTDCACRACNIKKSDRTLEELMV